MGSVSSWPVEVSISCEQQSREWTVHFKYVDPEARDSGENYAASVEDFLWIADERHINIDAFCEALKKSKNLELVALADEIQIAVKKQSHS